MAYTHIYTHIYTYAALSPFRAPGVGPQSPDRMARRRGRGMARRHGRHREFRLDVDAGRRCEPAATPRVGAAAAWAVGDGRREP